MFACAMYPTSDWFLETVNKEITTQLMRLNTHPSVISYITNNENEGALRDNWSGLLIFNFAKIWIVYANLKM